MTRLSRGGTIRRIGIITAVIAMGAVLVGGTGPVVTGSTGAAAVVATDRCSGGTEASVFVCRNTWITWTRHAVR